MSIIEGTLIEHYAKLWSYTEEIRRTNPRSTVKLGVLPMPDGCRKVVGLDGCFLKGFCSRELLCAIGKDAENQIYPIAWGVVCVENKDNWKWFLELLAEDLELNVGEGFTVMSDQHKGLIQAMKDVLPYAEHRQYARHICQNFNKRFGGAEYEKLFWRASYGSTEHVFKAAMKELETHCPAAHKYLMDKDPKTWSRAFYQTGRCCESVENGSCESFNAVIVEARKKPIITMLEEIRIYMMERRFNMKRENWSFDVSPDIRQKLNLLKLDQRFWMWELNGYGCVHSMASIAYLHGNPESYVDKMYTRTMYMKSYEQNILPMNGNTMWPETQYIPSLPPKNRRMPGRPTVKRKRDANEKLSQCRVSKKGKRVLCSICCEPGHNKTTCPTIAKPKKLKVKRSNKSTNSQGQPSGVGGVQGETSGVADMDGNDNGLAGMVGTQNGEVAIETNGTCVTQVEGTGFGVPDLEGTIVGVPNLDDLEFTFDDVMDQGNMRGVDAVFDLGVDGMGGDKEAGDDGGGDKEVGDEGVHVGATKEDAVFGVSKQSTSQTGSQLPKPTRKRNSERILKKKLAKNVVTKDGKGNSSSKPVELE